MFSSKNNNGDILETVKKYMIIVLGSFLFALSVNVFMLPFKIVSGGLSGIATVFYYLFGISTGITVGISDLLILFFALKILGKKFVMDSMVAIILIPIFLSITEQFPPITDDILIASVFGGVLLGIGIGMAFSQGGTTGGVDILSRISQKKYPHLSIGILMTVLDLIIITFSVITIGNLNLAFYGILSLVISTGVIDAIIARLNRAKLILAIVGNSSNIEKEILTFVNRGVTVINAIGAYSQEEKKILLCVMKPKQAEHFKKMMQISEPNSFMIVTDSAEILGNGFRYYR